MGDKDNVFRLMRRTAYLSRNAQMCYFAPVLGSNSYY